MKVLVAMDGSEVGEAALAAVASWAQISRAAISLLTVVQPSRVHETAQMSMVATVAGPSAVASAPRRKTIEDRTQALARARQQAQDYLSSMGARYLPTVPHSVDVIWEDDLADGICETAEAIHADLIAMGTHGRTGIGHALLGSVAEDVIKKASVPVLVVRHGTIQLLKNPRKPGPESRTAQAQVGKERLLTYLNQNGASFMLNHHAPAFSAHEMASLEHLPDHMVAKVVLAFADEAFAMFAIPGELKLDLPAARHLLGARDIRLATEEEMVAHIPDCEAGAVHPFGSLYGIPVYADRALVAQRSLAFFAGTHTDTVYVESADFVRLVQPVLAEITTSQKPAEHDDRKES